MKINLGLGPLDYGSIAKAVLPHLKAREDDSLVSRLMAAAAKLPAEALAQLIGSLPREELDGIAVLLVEEKQEKLLEACGKFLERQGLPLRLSAVGLSEDMELSLTVDNIDYAALARHFLPLIPAAVLDEHAATKVLASLMKLPSALLYAALEKIPAEKLEAALIFLINRYSGVIVSKLRTMACERGIDLSPTALRAER